MMSRWMVAAALVATALSPALAQAGGRSGPLPGCGLSPEKCYSFTMEVVGSAHPGSSAQYRGTLKNLSSGGGGQRLGSANITWSPPDAFFSLTKEPGDGVVVDPPGSTTPSETVTGSRVELRELGTAPGGTVTFTFHAVALRSGTVTWHSAAKQANQFLGVGNDLVQSGDDPTTRVDGDCGGTGTDFNSYGCQGVPKATGGTACTGFVDSGGAASTVRACFTLPPVPGATGFQLVVQQTYLGREECPVQVECAWVTQLLSKLAADYDAGHAVTLTVFCGPLCGQLFFQQDDATGDKEPLLPCLAVPVPAPLTGSLACISQSGDGTVTVAHITSINDYKVMGFPVPGTA